jgi:hypothetical protein
MWPACVFGKYSGSILGTYGVYGKRSKSIHLVLGVFGMRCWVPYAFRPPRMVYSETIWCIRNHSETILKTFGKQTESIRWYIEEIWVNKYIRWEIRTVSKIPPLSYPENKRNGIWSSVMARLHGYTWTDGWCMTSRHWTRWYKQFSEGVWMIVCRQTIINKNGHAFNYPQADSVPYGTESCSMQDTSSIYDRVCQFFIEWDNICHCRYK